MISPDRVQHREDDRRRTIRRHPGEERHRHLDRLVGQPRSSDDEQTQQPDSSQCPRFHPVQPCRHLSAPPCPPQHDRASTTSRRQVSVRPCPSGAAYPGRTDAGTPPHRHTPLRGILCGQASDEPLIATNIVLQDDCRHARLVELAVQRDLSRVRKQVARLESPGR